MKNNGYGFRHELFDSYMDGFDCPSTNERRYVISFGSSRFAVAKLNDNGKYEIVDDSKGYGYKTPDTAYWGYRLYRCGLKDEYEKDKRERAIARKVKAIRDFTYDLKSSQEKYDKILADNPKYVEVFDKLKTYTPYIIGGSATIEFVQKVLADIFNRKINFQYIKLYVRLYELSLKHMEPLSCVVQEIWEEVKEKYPYAL
jgi:hypothetical protein